MDGNEIALFVNVLNGTEFAQLKIVKMVNFMLCILSTIEKDP